MNAPTQPVQTGLDLKIARLRRGVQGKAIAAALGVSKVRVSAIEGAQRPTAAAIERYLAALDRVAR